MRDDLKAAVRSLASSRTFTVVALLVLTLGIGASTAVFSVVDAVVLKGLPFDEHDRMVAIGERRPPNPDFPGEANRDPRALSPAAPQNYMDWAARQQAFEAIAATAGMSFALREPGTETEELRGLRVTAGFFDVLRERPRLGQPFTSAHEIDGQHRVAVLSHGFWTRRFGADPEIVGRLIGIEGGPYEVIGVMAPEFQYPVGAARATDVWVPYVVPPDDRVRDPNNVNTYIQAVARLKPGVSLAQAQGDLDRISDALTAEHPAWNKDTRAGLRPLRDHIVGAHITQWMLMLLGAVATVLLIACANVANLLLARASSREREVGIRAALGAGRGRLMRQLMVESLVLSLLGTALAVLAASWVVGVLANALPEGVPRVSAIALDLRVLGAAAALSIVTGLLFGLVPALQLSRPDLTHALKDGARGASTGGARQRMRSALVVVEVALAVVLLVGAALFIASFQRLARIDPGFEVDDVLLVNVVPRLERGISTGNELPDYGPQLHEIVQRLRDTPGVRDAAAISGGVPLGTSMSTTNLAIPGRVIERADRSISIRRVTPDYHQALGIPLEAGRYFEPGDRAGTPQVIIINASAARKYFAGANPLGKTITMSGADRTIVGVVGDVYQSSLEVEPRTEAYLPMAQQRTLFSELVIKTTGDPYALLPAVRSAVEASMPGVLLRNFRTMDQVIVRATAQRRFNMLLLGLFGLLGLVISAVGIYGVMAYLVSLRTREIGVRMALGATRGAVVLMVLRNASVLVAVGLIAGAAGAWLLSSAAARFVFQTDVTDPRAFAAAIGTLALAALIAAIVPARRAARVDPAIALRAE